MKNFLLKVALFSAMFAGLALTGCEQDDPIKDAAMGAEVTSTTLTSAAIKVISFDITEYAYTVSPKASATMPTADAVFANGTVKEMIDGEDVIALNNLTPETEYVAYVAGRVGSNYYPTVFELAFATKDIPVSMAATLVESATTAQTLTIELDVVKIKKYAYTIVKAAEAPETTPDAAVVFADGTAVDCTTGKYTIKFEELSPNTEYVVYIAGQEATTDELFADVLTVKATTGDFTEELTIFDNTGRSFKLHVKPQLTDPANVIKWGTCDIFMYNMNQQPDFEMLNLHDQYYGNYFQGDTTLVFDEEHGYVWSDEMGDYIQYFEAIVPGQPQYLALGEFKYEEDEDVHGRWGWGAGYYMPLMDMEGYYNDLYAYWYGETDSMPEEAPYWTGYHKSIKFQTKAPEALDANLSVDLSGLRANGGPIRINTNGNADRVTVMLLDPMTFEQIMPFLDNNEDYLQWFTTSYIGYMMVGAQTFGGANIQFEMTDFLWEVDKDEQYKLLVVAAKDEVEGSLDAKYQQFTTVDVALPDYSLPAPVVEITPLEVTEQNTVSFNVKCTSQDAASGLYAANYEREWAEAGFDEAPAEAMEYNGNELTADDIAQINSAEGMVFEFWSREDAVTTLGVMLKSIEGLAGEVVIASNKSLPEPDKAPVTSEYFTSLDGDWTATTTVINKKYVGYDPNTYQSIYEDVPSTKTWKVTIGDVDYPAELTDDVYQTWFDATPYDTKEEVDAQYELFKAAVDNFNAKTAGQNRILMNGFDVQKPNYEGSKCYSQYASPFELWSSDSYNGYDNASPVWDFGPKWYLEVAEDGTVTAPFNVNYFAPITAWTEYHYAFYFAGVGPESFLPYDPATGENAHFPVEISEDGNTITVKPYVFEGENFYPNMGYISYGSFSLGSWSSVAADIVLTRGWTEPAPEEEETPGVAKAGIDYKPANKIKSHTAVKALPTYEKVEMKVVSVDEFKANVEKFRKAMKTAVRK